MSALITLGFIAVLAFLIKHRDFVTVLELVSIVFSVATITLLLLAFSAVV